MKTSRSEKKIQATFFDTNEMPEEFWVWVVEIKWTDSAMRDALGRDPRDPIEWENVTRPNHFRLETNAVKRAEEIIAQFKRGAELKLFELRISPKYLGYKPDADERWII